MKILAESGRLISDAIFRTLLLFLQMIEYLAGGIPGEGGLGAYGTGWGISTEGEWNDHFQDQDLYGHLWPFTGLWTRRGSARKHRDTVENHC